MDAKRREELRREVMQRLNSSQYIDSEGTLQFGELRALLAADEALAEAARALLKASESHCLAQNHLDWLAAALRASETDNE